MAEQPAASHQRVSEGANAAAHKANVPHSEVLYRAAMFDFGAFLARVIPLRFLRALAGLVGWIYAFLNPLRVGVVRRNLLLLDESASPRKARRVYFEFGRTLADYFYIGTRPVDQAMHLVSQIDGADHLRNTHELGRGALIVTAHHGLFELGGLLLAWQGYDTVVLTYPEPSQALTRWRTAFRARWNAATVEVGTDSFAFLEVAQRLRRGCFVAALIDRPHPTDCTPVTLPNGQARFSTGILLLAAHHGVPVIPATMARRPDGTYHAQIFAPIFIEPRANRAETLAFYSQQIADTLRPVLCAYPEQWYQFVPIADPPAGA